MPDWMLLVAFLLGAALGLAAALASLGRQLRLGGGASSLPGSPLVSSSTPTAPPVVVPVCAHTPPALLQAVTRLYGERPLILVHVVVVPRDLPLEAGLTPVEEEEIRAMMEELREVAEEGAHAPVSVEILHGREAARTLLDWIARVHPAVVVLSLHPQQEELSPTALSLLRHAPAQVWVWRGPEETGHASTGG